MAAMSYGKRMLVAGLQKSGSLKRAKRLSPENTMKYFCHAGIDQDGFAVRYISDIKGYGVFSQEPFKAGEFLLEYIGEKITPEEANRRHKKTQANNKIFHYKYNGKDWCIDAEETLDHICQLVNDAADAESNATMKLKIFDNTEHLCLFAKKDILPGDEILYNYGDEDNLWWRKKIFRFMSSAVNIQLSDCCKSMETKTAYWTEPERFVAIRLKNNRHHNLRDMVSDSDPFDVGSLVSDSEDYSECTDISHVGENGTLFTAIFDGKDTGHYHSDTVQTRRAVEPSPDDPPSPNASSAYQSFPYDQLSSADQPTPDDQQSPNASSAYQSFPYDQLSSADQPTPDDQQSPNASSADQTTPDDQQSPDDLPCSAVKPLPPIPEEDGSSILQVSEDSNMSCKIPVVSCPGIELEPPSQEEPLRNPVNLSCSARETVNNGRKATGKSKYKPKPERFCIFCKSVVKGGKLKRHIKRNHKSNTEIIKVLTCSKQVQHNFFDQKRKEGIFEFNVKVKSENERCEMRERTPKLEDRLRVCLECKGFFSSKYFSKHKCIGEEKVPLKPELMNKSKLQLDQDEGFVSILNRFRDGPVGTICRTDIVIKQVGYRHFNLRRHETSIQEEVRKEVMAEMRTLARLLLEFKTSVPEDVTVESMFSRDYLPELRDAIDRLSKKDNDHVKDEKHGLKLLIDAVILRSIKSLLGYYSETKQDEKYKEMKMFRMGYRHKAAEMFAKARYQCRKNSVEKARHPKHQVKDWDLKNLRNFISVQLKEVVENFQIKDYTWLRTLLIGRLTLFNARRGEEPSRMLCTELKDALNDVWYPADFVENIIDDAEKYLVGEYKLGYLKGKGKKYVPFLIPIDTIAGLKILMHYRKEFGIIEQNQFLFASKSSMGHASGWLAISDLCKQAGANLPVTITATKVRHWISTLYASMDMSAQEQRIFLEHMGHEKDINKDNYQTPLSLQHVQVMGKMLHMAETETLSHHAMTLGPALSSAEPAHQEPALQVSCSNPSINEEDSNQGMVNEELSRNDADSRRMKTKKRKEKGAISAKWSSRDTKQLRTCFKDFIFGNGLKNEGRLPSKEEILHFVDHCQPLSIRHMCRDDQYWKVRSKVFNERKTVRLNIKKRTQAYANIDVDLD